MSGQILVVDDDRSMCELLQTGLARRASTMSFDLLKSLPKPGGRFDLPALHGSADAHALARRQLRAGQQGLALEHLRAGRQTLDTAGLLELAQLHRRLGEWNAALAIWQPLADQDVIQAILALAKFHEHVARDFDGALAACQALVSRQPGEPAHRLRLARVARKLAGARQDRAGGAIVGLPSQCPLRNT